MLSTAAPLSSTTVTSLRDDSIVIQATDGFNQATARVSGDLDVASDDFNPADPSVRAVLRVLALAHSTLDACAETPSAADAERLISDLFANVRDLEATFDFEAHVL
jgi:hypothetical protein